MIDREGFRQRLTELERELEEAQKDKKDIYEEMIRQYQQFQCQTNSQIQCLEAEKQNLQEELGIYPKDSLDQVLSKLQATKLGWEKETTLIHTEYKNALKEFGLNPLEF
ncbi:Coiled-coil domain-containing protein, partial [Ophiophagus hannah]